MSDIAIRVEHISKRYRLGEREPYKSLREAIARAAAAPLGRMRRNGQPADRNSKDYFWALDDVSFEIKQGEAVGIIGRNGAGKSTLLKILSRITKPTLGQAKIFGRVGSLLEVGTGFHPELTGRENIYLNGAILGMKRAEIERKFDEIVAFSEVEKFLDMPVKRYSSGMYVRLAFAVAAHMEPEILLVDEVLAVGDSSFQTKCLGKMGEVTKGGRTVLFVSHNMAAIENLCPHAILLLNGRMESLGNTDKVIASYLSRTTMTTAGIDGVIATGLGGALQLLSMRVNDSFENHDGVVRCGQDIRVSMEVHSAKRLSRVTFLLALNNRLGNRITVLNSTTAGYQFDLPEGISSICQIPRFPLSPGTYEIEAKILSGSEHLLAVPNASQLVVETGDFYGSGKFPDLAWAGICHLRQEWKIR